MSEFIKGIELCESFFFEVAEPIIRKYFPNLTYTAGLIGYGSDVLGYDDATSTDHMWGPRFYLFLSKEDIGRRQEIEEVLSEQLPYTYKSYSVNFSSPDPADNGVRLPLFISEGKVSPLIFIQEFEEFMNEYLGKTVPTSFDYYDWLSFSEHRLLGFTSGKLFVDMLGIEDTRRKLRFYPHEVKLYMLASNWSIIAEEQAFVKRCGECGDELGSRIITARIADRLMRLCFLYEDRYAPYSKWFGTAFHTLDINPEISDNILKALAANDLLLRENYIVLSQKSVADLHNAKGITPVLDCKIEAYFGRDIKVIHAERIAAEIMKLLKETVFEAMPLISTFSQVGNLNALSDHVGFIDRIKRIYN